MYVFFISIRACILFSLFVFFTSLSETPLKPVLIDIASYSFTITKNITMALNGKNKLKTCPIWNKNYTNYIDLYLKKEKTNSHKK